MLINSELSKAWNTHLSGEIF